MDLFLTAAIVATFLCSLVAGFLFAFAVVAMPGIRNLNDAEFIRAFQVMDRVIQNNQPLFLIVWVGSAVVLLVALILGFGQLAGVDRLLLVASAVVYILGVQLPTVAINVPLNNRLQMLDVVNLDEAERQTARNDFEQRWNRWNASTSIALESRGGPAHYSAGQALVDAPAGMDVGPTQVQVCMGVPPHHDHPLCLHEVPGLEAVEVHAGGRAGGVDCTVVGIRGFPQEVEAARISRWRSSSCALDGMCHDLQSPLALVFCRWRTVSQLCFGLPGPRSRKASYLPATWMKRRKVSSA